MNTEATPNTTDTPPNDSAQIPPDPSRPDPGKIKGARAPSPVPWTIAKKELADYFKTIRAYLILVVTISIFNVFFFVILDQNREASLRDMFRLMEFLFIFIVPILTMSLFAEEKKAGTLEFLLTCPIKTSDIILGKFLGSFLFIAILIAITGVYYVILEIFGTPDRGAILSGYLGMFLVAAFFVAIGMLASSWTKNQIIAAITSYVILMTLYFSVSFLKYFKGTTEFVIRYVSFWSHTENLTSGLVQAADIVYFLVGILACFFLTRYSLGQRT